MAGITEVALVYNASWSLTGGMRYLVEWVRDQKEPCALCALTHQGVSERSEWSECALALGIPVQALYLDGISPEQAALVGDAPPAVLVQRGDAWEVLLDRQAIEALPDTDALVAAITSAVLAENDTAAG